MMREISVQLRAIIVQRDTQHHETLLAVARLQVGHFRDASETGRAPRRPKIEDHHLALEVTGGDRRSIQPREFDRRRARGLGQGWPGYGGCDEGCDKARHKGWG